MRMANERAGHGKHELSKKRVLGSITKKDTGGSCKVGGVSFMLNESH